jgi:uncharacterized membrane-anchored protein
VIIFILAVVVFVIGVALVLDDNGKIKLKHNASQGCMIIMCAILGSVFLILFGSYFCD